MPFVERELKVQRITVHMTVKAEFGKEYRYIHILVYFFNKNIFFCLTK